MKAAVEVLALIPARGGSKGIPRKNIRLFAGHPLIAYSIAAGLQAETVTRVIVSTDDEEIAAIAREYGAEVPFLRPAHLALDDTPDYPVFLHALRWLEEREGYRPDIIVQLRPTSPIRPRDLVDRGVRLLLEHPEADSVRAVVPSGQNPFKMWRIEDDGYMRPLLSVEGIPEPYNTPRQRLPQTFWQTGHLDVMWRRTLLEKGSMTGRRILPLLVEPRYTVDLDNPWDWERAEWTALHRDLDMVWPGRRPRPMPQRVDLLVLDFDGVFTDNRVWVDETGREAVMAHRGDGMGLEMLRQAGIRAVVLSKETNPVVAARCRKLNLPVWQGVEDKAALLRRLLEEWQVDPRFTVYLGNDVNDIPCFSLVGWAVVVADAHPQAKRAADKVLRTPGGYGAIRELVDLILARHHAAGSP